MCQKKIGKVQARYGNFKHWQSATSTCEQISTSLSNRKKLKKKSRLDS